MIELTATTLTVLGNLVDLASYNAEIDILSQAGIYVTASMWEDCDNASCVGTANEILPEPKSAIPLQVLVKNTVDTAEGDDGWWWWYANNNDVQINDLRAGIQTNTVKLFFPDSKLSRDTKYFITLEFHLHVTAAFVSCYYYYFDLYTRLLAQAGLGPHIIDAEVIHNGDFGNCSWLDSETDGCGFFDAVSGSADPNCGE